MWISEFYESHVAIKGRKDIPRKQNPSRDIGAEVIFFVWIRVDVFSSVIVDNCVEQMWLCQIVEGLVHHADEYKLKK